MSVLETAIELIVEIARTVLIEELSGRLRLVRFRGRLRGMNEVKRHVHRQTRRKLLNRLSTDAVD